MPSEESPYDILIIELITGISTTAIYACLRKEYNQVVDTVEGKTGFAFNGITITPSLGYIDGAPQNRLDTHILYDCSDHYEFRIPSHNVRAIANQIRRLGITLSPTLIDSVALSALGFDETQIAAMRQNGRLRRVPLTYLTPVHRQ